MKKRDIKLTLESLIAIGEGVSKSRIAFSDSIQKDLSDLRTMMVYTRFDLEATRRERDYWFKKATGR